MIRFNCDYSEGAHEVILKKLMETNMAQTAGYGCDVYCDEARVLIQKICDRPDAYVQFLVGGTQANLTVIASALRPYQGVIAADTGHIAVHETGAIEATGHKVLTLPNMDGKISAKQVEECLKLHFEDEAHEHMVQPGMVYISQPTELGTIYYKDELEALYQVCQKNGIMLFVDGARLGYGLMAADCDMTIQDLAHNCDVFYFGGTKMGALFGEAVVILNEKLKKDFRYMIKQKGGMLAKGRLLGIQFLGLLEKDLYWEIGKCADALADEIRSALVKKQIPCLVENQTNQIFPILEDKQIEKLQKDFSFSYQERVDDTHSAIRFCTSWATTKEQVKALCESILSL